MTELKTKASLLAALDAFTTLKPPKEELHNQRVSFIMGSVGEKSAVTREKVEKALAEIAQ